jgi:hypothetical protein
MSWKSNPVRVKGHFQIESVLVVSFFKRSRFIKKIIAMEEFFNEMAK